MRDWEMGIINYERPERHEKGRGGGEDCRLQTADGEGEIHGLGGHGYGDGERSRQQIEDRI